jgi:AcrR family transcriptional regulator
VAVNKVRVSYSATVIKSRAMALDCQRNGIIATVEWRRKGRTLTLPDATRWTGRRIFTLALPTVARKRAKGLRFTVPMQSGRPPWRPTPGSPESSERTRFNILSAAQRLLATNGYAAFTTRAVAAAAGIKPGNLAYHYKTKRELLRAVITTMTAEYARQIDDFFNKRSSESRDGFAELVAWLIRDSTTRDTSRLARELWAMALHDPFVARAMDGYYEILIVRIIESLRKIYPGLSKQRATDITYLMATVSEGSNSIFGTASRKATQISRVTSLAIEVLMRAMREPGDE